MFLLQNFDGAEKSRGKSLSKSLYLHCCTSMNNLCHTRSSKEKKITSQPALEQEKELLLTFRQRTHVDGSSSYEHTWYILLLWSYFRYHTIYHTRQSIPTGWVSFALSDDVHTKPKDCAVDSFLFGPLGRNN